MKVLLISDSENLVQDISLALQVRWPDVILVWAGQGKKGINLIEAEQPDITIIDLGSFDINGLDILSEIRSFFDLPIIALTSGNDAMDKVRALEVGADGWIGKPFMPIELLAEVNAVLRRSSILKFQYNHPLPFVSDKLSINYATREVYVSGKPVRLTPTEYNVLCHLLRNQAKVVTHRSLLDNIWGPRYTKDTGSLKEYIYRLRSKLEDDPENPRMLVTERGIGYKFVGADLGE
jgi:DNA-binding response OmpR family regulator